MKNFFLLLLCSATYSAQAQIQQQPVLGHRSAKILSIDGLSFKDLNRNGQLDKYEDWRLPYSVRSKDLVAKMSLEEKTTGLLKRLKIRSPSPAISTKKTWWLK